jgi:geranylgeranyl reductase family protein
MNIAVLGGGPSGAFAGERLATAGFPVTIFDEKLAWEKPCGGGLTAKALERYPFLGAGEAPIRFVNRAVLVASNGARVCLRLRRSLAIYSRQVLNGLLLERARRAGAAIVQDRIVSAEQSTRGWKLAGKQSSYTADFCVVATGARNPLRQLGTELRREDAYVALGYYVPGDWDHIEVQFRKGLEGYLWVFPRTDHLSVGICGRITAQDTRRLRQMVEEYMAEHKLPIEGSRFYCHLLPSLAAKSFDRNRVSGAGWAAAGDAAGVVDPITGEGIYFALRSADLLAGCLIEGRVADYAKLLRQELTGDLQLGAKLANWFYHGRFLLDSVTTRMVQLSRRSTTFENLIQDMFAGSQNYLGLKSRLWRQLGLTLWELAASLRRRAVDDSHEPLKVQSSI